MFDKALKMNEGIENEFKVLLDRKVVTICCNKIAFQKLEDYIVSLQSCFLQMDEQIVIDLSINEYSASNGLNIIADEILVFFNNNSLSFSQFLCLDIFSRDFPQKKLFIILKNPFFLSDQNEDVTLIQKIRSLIEKIRFCENVFLVILMVESEKSGFCDSYYSQVKSKYIDQTHQIHIR
jgi:hypothetical protein